MEAPQPSAWINNTHLSLVQLRWDRTCRFCGVPWLTGERSGFCCGLQGNHSGDVRPLPLLPAEYNYFVNDPNVSGLSRKLNLLFSFAAMETTATFPNSLGGMIAIQGKLYHRIRPNNQKSGARWLLYDGYMRDAAPPHDWLPTIPQPWTHAISTALLRCNPFAQTLHTLSQQLIYAPQANIVLHDSGSVSEIAAIIRHDNSTPGDLPPRSLIIMPNTPNVPEAKVSIPTVSRFWEPLAYPLLFPHGTLGWGITQADTQEDLLRGDEVDAPTTQLWHYRARLLREPRFEIFGRLTNEYLVDMFSRDLETRLHYIRQNQERLRREDALLMGDAAVPPSENIYLPASFLGSRRWSAEQVADALTLAGEWGGPTFFCTMTCNTMWPEITERLRPGQTFADIPLVVARVFAQKLTILLQRLKALFSRAGRQIYSIYVIEFQKRGVPHAHILIKFDSPCVTPTDIDLAVSAEMPDDPSDAALVRRFMIHRHTPYCQREQQGHIACRFGYPKPLTPETTIDAEGRVNYRRRKEEDAWVVPYNLSLLRQFECHINLEVANTSQLFQYIFKYIHKGPDRTRFAINTGDDPEPVDEIEEYWAGRYLSAGEAAWRILGKHITHKQPAVTSLPIHLPNSSSHHQYHRRDGNHSKLSRLDRYFLRPLGHFYHNGVLRPFADLTYIDYYKMFRFEALPQNPVISADLGTFLEQGVPFGQPQRLVIQRDPVRLHLARIAIVRPSAGETFYLRALLNHRSASSFRDLRTIDGQEYPSFQQAASALGIFAEEREAEYVLTEAVAAQYTPRQIRLLFVHLLVNDCCTAPLDIYERFYNNFSHDFFLHNNLNPMIAQRLTLEDIGRMLAEYGKRLGDFGLPSPDRYPREVQAELERWNANPEGLALRAHQARARFTEEQSLIYDDIMHCVRNSLPLNLFIDGKAGCGKTFLLNAICDSVRSMSEIVIPTASSAFAAQLYEGGRTAHSAFKIPVEEHAELLRSPIEPGHSRSDLLEATKVFIWDEAPMANRAALACAEDVLRRITDGETPFGGKIMLLVGDFRQTSPVVRGGTRTQVVDASIRSSHLWPLFSIRHLTVPIRNAADPMYAHFVDAIGDGAGPQVQLTPFLHAVATADDLIDFVFPPHLLLDPSSSVLRSILAPTNEQIDGYNQQILDRMEGHARQSFANDSIKQVDESALDDGVSTGILDYVARRTIPGLPPYSLTLKVGAVYRLMRNLSIDKGLVKNVRCVIQDVGCRIVAVRIIGRPDGIATRNEDLNVVILPRIPFEHTLYSGHILVRRQFPLAPAYATTFNSCQGLTLDRVGVDLTRPVFSHGQLYTALSRVRTRRDIAIRVDSSETTTLNVTYNEILL